MIEKFKNFQFGTNHVGSKTTALHSLLWVLGLFLPSLATLTYLHAAQWLIISIFVLFSLLTALFFGSFIYLLLNKPEYLRSEHFGLQKMAIDRGLLGDSAAGLKTITTDDEQIKKIEGHE